jgi:hypothetical protein
LSPSNRAGGLTVVGGGNGNDYDNAFDYNNIYNPINPNSPYNPYNPNNPNGIRYSGQGGFSSNYYSSSNPNNPSNA